MLPRGCLVHNTRHGGSMRHVLRCLLVWILLTAVCTVLRLDAQAPTPDAAKITFEVASIKPNTSTGGPQNIQLLPSGLLTGQRFCAPPTGSDRLWVGGYPDAWTTRRRTELGRF